MGGIPERELEKLKQEAEAQGKGSFVFAFFTDKSKEERERGITISTTTKEFYTDKYHYTVVDNPGHAAYLKNFLTGSSTADVGILLLPTDNYIAAMAKEDRDNGIEEGQARRHSLLFNLLGIKQLIVCVNKMDGINYSEEKFNELSAEVQNMLVQVGWPKPFVQNNVPIIPISAWTGDNLLTSSSKMPWWKGTSVKDANGTTQTVTTVMDALNNFVQPPVRLDNAVLRMPVSSVHCIKGVGDVICGRIEQGTLKPGDQVVFLPTDTPSLECKGKVFSIEMHHKSVPTASSGDNVGLNIKGLNKKHLPKTGDIMIIQSDKSLSVPKKITIQAKMLNHPGELKVGYCPVGCVRTKSVPMKIVKFNWKMGKETGGKKNDDSSSIVSIKTGDVAEIVFEPQKQIVVDEYKNCEGLGRIAFLEGSNVILLGKVVKTE
jgi:elongation factor 1-alpha